MEQTRISHCAALAPKKAASCCPTHEFATGIDCCVLMCLHRGVVDALRLGRAFPHSQAQSAGFGATPQLTHLVLFGVSIRRERHKSAMSIVMGVAVPLSPFFLS
jgi:hypothetical protein